MIANKIYNYLIEIFKYNTEQPMTNSTSQFQQAKVQSSALSNSSNTIRTFKFPNTERILRFFVLQSEDVLFTSVWAYFSNKRTSILQENPEESWPNSCLHSIDFLCTFSRIIHEFEKLWLQIKQHSETSIFDKISIIDYRVTIFMQALFKSDPLGANSGNQFEF